MLKAALYYHTVKHLRLAQILGRLRVHFPAPVPASSPPPTRSPMTGTWTPPPSRPPSILGPATVRFLNVRRELRLPADWQGGNAERLWLYNLHYFDDFAAADTGLRTAWQRALVAAWIRDNPPVRGPGWEPYPLSLRVVNWIKWALAGHTLDGGATASLAQQLRFLEKRIEWHLLGNHVLANAKALAFGGLVFSGDEADRWLERAGAILIEQFEEQILGDGGHFERSPMYHAIALEDALDLLNAMRAYPERKRTLGAQLEEMLLTRVPAMAAWLRAMCHPDGGIAFFNDAAFGIALDASALEAYGANLGLRAAERSDLTACGYARLRHGEWCVIFDAAPLGPDYQPGHAHADTLAFELSVGAERVIVNSGTSTYEAGPQRAHERATRAHNTVEIDGESSSEMWAAFRVARRARPVDRRTTLASERSSVSCAHDGYRRLPGSPLHRRAVEVDAEGVRWSDRVEGSGEHAILGFIPLHPGVRAEIGPGGAVLSTPLGRRLELAAEGALHLVMREGTFAPEFGVVRKRPVLVWQAQQRLPFEARFRLRQA